MDDTASTALFQAIFDASEAGIAILQPERNSSGAVTDFLLLRLNTRMLEWTDRVDYQGKRYTEIFPAVRENGILLQLAEVAETGTAAAFERWFDGRERRYFFRFHATRQAGVLILSLEDVTRQKEEEKRILRNEERLRFALRAGRLGSWELDLKTMTLEASDHCKQNFGRPADQPFTYQQLVDIIHPDDRARQEAEVMDTVTTGKDYNIEYRVVWPDRSVHWVNVRGQLYRDAQQQQPKYMVGVSVDITEQKQTQAALVSALDEAKQQQRLYNSIANNTPDLVYVFDLGYRFTYANKALLAMWGKTEREAIGKGLRENGYEEWHAAMHEREIDEIVRTKKRIRGSVSFPHAEEGVRVYDYIFTPVLNDEGEVEAVAGTTRDITELKLAEESLQQSEKRYRELSESLEQQVAQRTRELQRSNEDLQQFAHVASHDLKEPVRKIKTFAGRLLDQLSGRLDESSSQFMDRIQVAADRMSTMIDGVLAYSTINASTQRPEPVDLGQVVDNIDTDLELALQQSGGTLEHEALPVLEGAPVLIYQLFYNLVNNSIKFARKDVPPQIRISAVTESRAEGEVAVITVADNGIGFEAVYAEQIFETFKRLNSKDRYEGTGLGLALCKKIAERHRGTITAEGTEGNGAVFTVILPLKQDGGSI